MKEGLPVGVGLLLSLLFSFEFSRIPMITSTKGFLTMKTKGANHARALLVFLLSLLVLSGCRSGSGVRIGWVGRSVPGVMEARFVRFNGSQYQRVRLEEEDRLSITYSAELDAGKLTVALVAPDKSTVFEAEAKNQEETSEVAITKSGVYRVLIRAEQAKGRFTVTWKRQSD